MGLDGRGSNPILPRGPRRGADGYTYVSPAELLKGVPLSPTRHAVRAGRILAVALLLGGCTAGGRGADDPFAAPSERPGQGRVQVRVENQNFNDATVHALRGGERVRMGDVTGNSERSFTVRWNFTLPIEFEIDLIGGQGCRVRPMSVDPGDRVWVRIPTRLNMSPCFAGKGS